MCRANCTKHHSYLWVGLLSQLLSDRAIFASIGLSLAEIFYLQAIYVTTIVLLEAPFGYFADLFGRRAALIIGSVVHGLVYFVLNFSDSLFALIIFAITLGAATSLLSGTDLALLYDTQKALAGDENFEHSKDIANLGLIEVAQKAQVLCWEVRSR